MGKYIIFEAERCTSVILLLYASVVANAMGIFKYRVSLLHYEATHSVVSISTVIFMVFSVRSLVQHVPPLNIPDLSMEMICTDDITPNMESYNQFEIELTISKSTRQICCRVMRTHLVRLFLKDDLLKSHLNHSLPTGILDAHRNMSLV